MNDIVNYCFFYWKTTYLSSPSSWSQAIVVFHETTADVPLPAITSSTSGQVTIGGVFGKAVGSVSYLYVEIKQKHIYRTCKNKFVLMTHFCSSLPLNFRFV